MHADEQSRRLVGLGGSRSAAARCNRCRRVIAPSAARRTGDWGRRGDTRGHCETEGTPPSPPPHDQQTPDALNRRGDVRRHHAHPRLSPALKGKGEPMALPIGSRLSAHDIGRGRARPRPITRQKCLLVHHRSTVDARQGCVPLDPQRPSPRLEKLST